MWVPWVYPLKWKPLLLFKKLSGLKSTVKMNPQKTKILLTLHCTNGNFINVIAALFSNHVKFLFFKLNILAVKNLRVKNGGKTMGNIDPQSFYNLRDLLRGHSSIT